MSLCEYRFYAKTIGKQVGAFVILPDQGTPPFATLYLLHGLSDDYTIWLRRTRIEEYVKDLPLAIVMPDGFRGAYTNADIGPRYADYMIEDVVGGVEKHFRLKASRSARCIGGLSMGGYGALRLGLGFPDIFASVHAHSGALLWGTKPQLKPRSGPSDGQRIGEFELIFGKKPAGTEHDLVHLAKRCRQQKTLPKIAIDCGVEDFLIDDNREYVAQLERLGVPHTYTEHPGGHDWNYWDTHIRTAIAFHVKNLKLK